MTVGRRPPRALPGFDAQVAHPARVYDYWLGGTDNTHEVTQRVALNAAAHPQGGK